MSDQIRILVVDDEESIRGILNETLNMAGYEVIEASSAEEALKELSAHRFDIVLSDIRMTGLSGMQLLERIKAQRIDCEVIIMTSHASLETALEAIRLGAYDYLLKPFEELDYILAVVKRAVERHRLAGENLRLLGTLKEKNEDLVKATQKAAQILAEGHAARSAIERLLLSGDLREVSTRIIEGILRVIGRVRIAVLWILDENGGRLRPVAAHGIPMEGAGSIGISISGKGPVGQELFRWFESAKHLDALESLKKQWNVQSVQGKPLCIEGQGVGLLAWSETDAAVPSHQEGSLSLYLLVAAQVLRSRMAPPAASPSGKEAGAEKTGGPQWMDAVTPFFHFDVFQELLTLEVQRSRRYRHAVTLLLLSLDIPQGVLQDPILKEVAVRLRTRFRQTDIATRYKNKFFLMMPETRMEDGRKVEQAVLNLLEDYSKEHTPDPIRSKLAWTLSLVAYPKDSDTAEGLITLLESQSNR